VARRGSVTQAAAELLIAQPAVSAHLAALEAALGVRLFDRVGRGVCLNGAGAEFLAAAERMLTGVEKLRQHADQLLTLQRGVVTVATSTTAGNYVAPHLLGDFHQRYPRLMVKLEVCNRFAVQQKIISGEADLAVMGVVEGKEQLQVTPFLSNALVVVAPPSHPLAARAALPLGALGQEEFVVREQGSGTRRDMEELFHVAGVTLRIGLELGSTGAIKEAVAAGLGLAIIPLQSLELEQADGVLALLDITGFPVQRDWNVVSLRNRPLSPAAEALSRHLQSYYRSVDSCDDMARREAVRLAGIAPSPPAP